MQAVFIFNIHLNFQDDKKKDAEPLALPPPHLVAIAARRRPSKCTHLCVLFTALFVLAVGVIGGIYLYKHLAHKVWLI